MTVAPSTAFPPERTVIIFCSSSHADLFTRSCMATLVDNVLLVLRRL